MRLTASALDRVEACPGSVALKQRPHTGAASEAGRQIHAYLDRVAKVGRPVALGEIEDPDLQARCAAIDLDQIPAGSESEVAFAYDPDSDTAERLSLDEPRGYPDDGRIYGTADRVGIRAGSVAWIGDLKTGAMKMQARDALQLRFLALAVARFAGVDEAAVSMLYLRHDGKWYPDNADLDSFDLEETRGQLLELRARAREAIRTVEAGGVPTLVPGIHCEHCPAFTDCPARERQQQALMVHEPEEIGAWFAGLDEAKAGEIAEQAIVIGKLADKVREAANARAADLPDGLLLPSGRRLKRVRYGSTKQDAVAKARLAKEKDALREEGHITTEETWQIRVVGGARKR